MQTTAMNMHEYFMKLKQSNFNYKQKGYSYLIVQTKPTKSLPQKIDKFYGKIFPMGIKIKIQAHHVDNKIKKIQTTIIFYQLLLILFFATISFLLARISLKPMIESFEHLDRFTKDLIHDLNTPIASILVNTNMLKKSSNEKQLKKINRIEQSVKNISMLYDNLEVLLEKDLKKEQIILEEIIDELVEKYKSLYPNINFTIVLQSSKIISNETSMIRILDNLISNSCKYSNSTDPFVKITFKNNRLIIKDNGKGIKYPKRIFERNYKEFDKGHGIGLHIVYRLCSELGIKIDIRSLNDGVEVLLSLKS